MLTAAAPPTAKLPRRSSSGRCMHYLFGNEQQQAATFINHLHVGGIGMLKFRVIQRRGVVGECDVRERARGGSVKKARFQHDMITAFLAVHLERQ